MSFRRLATTAALVVVSSTAAVALAAAPAVAHPGALHPSTVDPHVLAAMQRDLGLTAHQARLRLASDAHAAAVQQQLTARLGHRFGGAYLQGGTLVVGVTSPRDAGAVLAAGARPLVVARSQAQLDAAVHRLDIVRAPAKVDSWYVDVRHNGVVVETSGAPTTSARAFARHAGSVPVRFARGRAAHPLTALRGGDAWFGSDFRCSVGFDARTAGGGRAFVTAGHCTKDGGTAYGPSGTRLGTMSGSTFGPVGDFGKVTVSGASWTLAGTVAHAGQDDVSVTGSTVAVIGAAVCRSGSTTGWHCGTITAKSQSVAYDGGVSVAGLTRTTVCAEPGDSGGAFISGTQAQGMTSGGSGDCTSGGTTYFQPIKEALKAYHLTLVTG